MHESLIAMVSSRLFWKLFLAFVGLHFVAAIVFGQVVAHWQEGQIRQQLDDRLRDVAVLVQSSVGDQLSKGRSNALQEEVRELGKNIGTRLTLIDRKGTVLADS